uniref:Uncharacterized protein n=1 Tax=Arundo donax TaxID=35708 RepID=A0A0A9CQS9_ARUDO
MKSHTKRLRTCKLNTKYNSLFLALTHAKVVPVVYIISVLLNNDSISRAKWHGVLVPVARNGEVPEPASLLLDVPLAQKRPREGLLRRRLHAVHQHVRVSRSRPARPRRHPGGVYGARHRRVHHDHVPLRLVERRR